MDIIIWSSFVLTVIVLALTPGPSVLLVAAKSMNTGFEKSIGTILGDLSANLLQIILASAGLASIVVTSGTLFAMIKWAGVGYLIFLGLKKIFFPPTITNLTKPSKQASWRSNYLEGFLVSASNPKAIVFFAALFPLFLDLNQALLPQIVILTITFLGIDGLSLLIYAFFANRLKNYLANRDQLYLQNKIVGVLLIFGGIMLSLVKRSK